MLLADEHRRLGGLPGRDRGRQPSGPVTIPQRVPAAVEYRGVDVGQGVAAVDEPGPVPVQAEDRVLHHVLGRGAVAEHDDREPDEPHRVRLVARGARPAPAGVRRRCPPLPMRQGWPGSAAG